MKTRFWLTSALVAIGLTAGQASASSVADDGWLPFQGCWRAVDAPAGSLLCVVADGNGVRMVELLSGETVKDTRLVADGRDRDVSVEGCTGTENARWSADGRRLYMTTALKCGEQIARNSAGMFAFVTPREWLAIQAVVVDDDAAVRTVRYQLVDSPTDVPESIMNALRSNRLARETARQFAAAPLTTSDIRDAADNVHGRAVEAMILERKQRFDVDGKQLVALSRAGVPGYLIDALVAVSNPQHFAVRDAKPTELAEVDVPSRGSRSAYCEEFWYSRYCDLRYGSGWYGYSPYGYYNPYGYGYGYRSGPVIVVIDDDDNDDTPRRGRVTRRGYSNGNSSGSSSRSGSDSPVIQSTAMPRSDSGSATTSSSSGGSSSSSSSGSSTSSGSGDRGKAKPRTGGN